MLAKRMEHVIEERKLPRVLVGISDTMDVVVKGHIDNDCKILNRMPCPGHES